MASKAGVNSRESMHTSIQSKTNADLKQDLNVEPDHVISAQEMMFGRSAAYEDDDLVYDDDDYAFRQERKAQK